MKRTSTRARPSPRPWTHPDVFSDLYINMVRAGEALEGWVVLQRLADYTEARLEEQAGRRPDLPGADDLRRRGIVLGLFTFVIRGFEPSSTL